MNKKNRNAHSQVSPLCGLPSAWPLRRLHPRAGPALWARPSPAARPLRGLAPPQASTHLLSSAPAHGGGSAHPPRCAKHGECSRESSLPTLPLPTPIPRLTCRPDPRGKQPPSLSFCGLSLTRWSAPELLQQFGQWQKGRLRPGSVACKFGFAPYWFFVLFDFFGIFPRSLGSGAALARSSPAVHSGAWREVPRAPAASRENCDESRARGGGTESSSGSAGSRHGPARCRDRGEAAATLAFLGRSWSHGRELDSGRDPGRRNLGFSIRLLPRCYEIKSKMQRTWNGNTFFKRKIEPLSRGKTSKQGLAYGFLAVVIHKKGIFWGLITLPIPSQSTPYSVNRFQISSMKLLK